ncbi:MAG TPA: DUF2834 domain-containing protein [Oculatellaceae cyanobacterium]|jgi:hypothetical protein
MLRKIALSLIWIVFVSYTVWLDPLSKPDTLPLVKKLLTFQWEEVNAILVAIFLLMGVWPMIFSCLMFADGTRQKIPAWPYFLASNFTGVLCLLPYLILRHPNQDFIDQKNDVIKILDSRSTGIALLLSTIALVVYAIIFGDWQDYSQEFQNIHFVHLISLDFCLMCVIFPLTSLFDDDMARRGINDSRIFWATALIPLFGPLVYLCLRPALMERTEREIIHLADTFSH